jgi:site-specific DNA recombinase
VIKGAIAPTRVTGYCRVSTEGQADEGISLDAQREKLGQYTALFNLQLVTVHVDAGISGKTLDRPGLRAALQDLEERRADGLLVVKLDRLTRSVRDLGELVDRYFAAGRWALLSVNEQIDTRSAAGRLMLHILGSVSQWERESTGERTRDALAHLKASGVRLGGAALGWRRAEDLDEDGRRVVQVVEEEQAIVDRIVELRSQGMSLRRIANVLTEEGLRTKRGGRWQPQTVANVIARVAQATA